VSVELARPVHVHSPEGKGIVREKRGALALGGLDQQGLGRVHVSEPLVREAVHVRAIQEIEQRGVPADLLLRRGTLLDGCLRRSLLGRSLWGDLHGGWFDWHDRRLGLDWHNRRLRLRLRHNLHNRRLGLGLGHNLHGRRLEQC
jgi:hypothetical protein